MKIDKHPRDLDAFLLMKKIKFENDIFIYKIYNNFVPKGI